MTGTAFDHIPPDPGAPWATGTSGTRRSNGHDAEAENTNPSGLKLIRFDDMRPQLSDNSLVKRLLGSTAMTVVYGEPGAGKTFFVLWLGLTLAAGFDFFGLRTRRCAVIYVAAEAGRGIENRVAAAKHEVEFPELMPFAAITSPIDLCSNDADLERLVVVIRSAAAELGMPVGLVIIDTLSRVLAGGNENGSEDMGAVVRNLDRLRDETGAAIVLVHHSGKDAARGARGHSLLRAATDTEIEVTRDDGTRVSTARVMKQRDLPTEGSFAFTLRQVELGLDADGDPVTSCVLEETEADAAASVKRKRLPDAAKIALNTLRKALTEAGQDAPGSNHIPHSTRVVDVETWRRFHYAGTASDGQSADARKKAFQRVRQQLQAHGIVCVHTDLCWIATHDA